MGDSRRFHFFAKLIERNLSNDINIADVAGGKGYLQAALRQLGYTQVTSWDKRNKYANSSIKRSYRYGYFDYKTAPEYDAVVAMHPDEGTDHCIMYAGLHRVPSIICPCCVKPSAVTFWGRHDYHTWIKHLLNLCEQQKLKVTPANLPITGRNDVLIIRP